ncbi:putative isxac3 transposase orfb (fragment) protein [Xanthomonas albilineans GPE PC73]|uniref:Putative isxac3 transposase orfb protein n=1 Tax=Xanthomonas albilineans (strain GPE PC73 / CFBP 7063) TaxID=380358 RepID=D2U8L9_XANAP
MAAQAHTGCLVHSDQGSVYTSDDWQSFLAPHGLVCSMSRRGNCHEREACPWGTTPPWRASSACSNASGSGGCLSRQGRRTTEVFDCIEMFYNPKRRHGSTDDLSPVECERCYAQRGS